MPVEESEILAAAQKLGDLVAQHPSVEQVQAGPESRLR